MIGFTWVCMALLSLKEYKVTKPPRKCAIFHLKQLALLKEKLTDRWVEDIVRLMGNLV